MSLSRVKDWISRIQQELPYSLLSDRQRVLIKALGAADGNKTTRSHFIFEKGGKLVDRQLPVKPVERSVPSTCILRYYLLSNHLIAHSKP
jgi:peroxiredoxin